MDLQVNTSFQLAFSWHFVWPPTCIYFGWAHIYMQVDAHFSPFGCTQHKSTQADHRPTVYVWDLQLFATCVNLQMCLRIHSATHHKSIHKFWFCFDLCWVRLVTLPETHLLRKPQPDNRTARLELKQISNKNINKYNPNEWAADVGKTMTTISI